MVDDDTLAQCVGLQDDELTVLESIYPDHVRVHENPLNKPGRLLTLTIPISLPSPGPIFLTTSQPAHSHFPSSSSHSHISSSSTSTSIAGTVDVTHLPPISLRVHLPPSYPLLSPPRPIFIHARPPNPSRNGPLTVNPGDQLSDGEWLSRGVIRKLRDRMGEIWVEDKEMIGEGTGVLWKWWEWISSGEFLNIHEGVVSLEVPPTTTASAFHTMLKSYNAAQLHSSFENTAFSCSICLENRKGKSCVEMPCGCVFCNPCLNSCWSLAITEGALESVSCPSVSCTKKRATRDPSKPVAPGGEETDAVDAGLVESVVGKELTERWKVLKERRRAEIDPTYTTCPRPTCQAAVPPPAPPTADDLAALATLSKRSKTIRLSDLSTAPLSSSTLPTPSDPSPAATPSTAAAAEDRWERYRLCPVCHYSFCLYCSATWHGPHTRCAFPQMSSLVQEYLSYPEGSEGRKRMETQRGKANMERMVGKWQEDESNRKWLQERTRPCAGCGVRVEKSHGCNHMTCGRCSAHFCYRCGDSISPSDPYAHFRRPGTSCFEKLFDQEEIDRFEREVATGVGGGGGLVGDEDDWREVRGVWEW